MMNTTIKMCIPHSIINMKLNLECTEELYRFVNLDDVIFKMELVILKCNESFF